MAFKSMIPFFCFLLVSSAIAEDITEILSPFTDYSTFTKLLTSTKVADEINSRETVTVLVLDNSAVSAISSLPPNQQKQALSVHVILDYYDPVKLDTMKDKNAVLTTLFQASGQATGQMGFVKYTELPNEQQVFGSAVAGASMNSNLIKVVAARPYNISVMQVSTAIIPPGLGGSAKATPPTGSAQAPPPAQSKSPSSNSPSSPASSNSTTPTPSSSTSPSASNSTSPSTQSSGSSASSSAANSTTPASSSGTSTSSSPAPTKSGSATPAPTKSATSSGATSPSESTTASPAPKAASPTSSGETATPTQAPSGSATTSPSTAPTTAEGPASSDASIAASPDTGVEGPAAAGGPAAVGGPAAGGPDTEASESKSSARALVARAGLVLLSLGLVIIFM